MISLHTNEKKETFYKTLCEMVEKSCSISGKCSSSRCCLFIIEDYNCVRVAMRRFLKLETVGDTGKYDRELLKDQLHTMTEINCDSQCDGCKLYIGEICAVGRLRSLLNDTKFS